MALAEGVQATIAYKAYASGTITANTQDHAPGTGSASYLRRVSSTINLARSSYQSQEIRTDRQVIDFRLGTKSVGGEISGELSPSAYFTLIEAAHRDTSVAQIDLDQSDFTSVAASASGSTFTFTSGDPVTLGLRVGDPLRFTGLSEALNNSTNYIVTGFSGTANRVMAVYPPPTDMGADSTFDLSRPGKSTEVPSTSFVSRKFAFEITNTDRDISRLYTECRVARYSIQVPASGLVTTSIGIQGRDMMTLSGGSSPYFVSPTAPGTDGLTAAVNGVILLDGASVGIITGITINYDMAAETAAVVGQDFAAEIFLGRSIVTGQLTAYLSDSTLLDSFEAETLISIMLDVTTTTDADSPLITIIIPSIKLSSVDVPTQGEGGQLISANFTALKYTGADPGMPETTIRIVDSEA